MTQEAPDLQALARWVIAHETDGASDARSVATAIERAFGKLEKQLVGLVGVAGFQALIARAVHLTRPRWRWLEARRVHASASLVIEKADESVGRARVDATIAIDGLADAVSREGEAQVKEGSAALLATTVDLLCSFIGAGLTFRMLRRAWPELPHARRVPVGGRHHERE